MKLDNYRCNTCVLNKNWIEKDEHFTNMLLLVFLPTCNIYIYSSVSYFVFILAKNWSKYKSTHIESFIIIVILYYLKKCW